MQQPHDTINALKKCCEHMGKCRETAKAKKRTQHNEPGDSENKTPVSVSTPSLPT